MTVASQTPHAKGYQPSSCALSHTMPSLSKKNQDPNCNSSHPSSMLFSKADHRLGCRLSVSYIVSFEEWMLVVVQAVRAGGVATLSSVFGARGLSCLLGRRSGHGGRRRCQKSAVGAGRESRLFIDGRVAIADGIHCNSVLLVANIVNYLVVVFSLQYPVVSMVIKVQKASVQERGVGVHSLSTPSPARQQDEEPVAASSRCL